jgi:photosystem II stability/assembly factor-like uncharacterized protein
VSLITAADFKPEIHKFQSNSLSHALAYFDDSPIVMNLNNKELFRSENDGKEWKKAIDSSDIINIHVDQVKTDRAFAFTSGKDHYVTDNRGKSWRKITLDIDPASNYEKVDVNYKIPDEVIFSFSHCDANGCTSEVYYTKDGFKSNPSRLSEDVSYCTFAKSNKAFDVGRDSKIFCLKPEKRDGSKYIDKIQLISSTDFFQNNYVLVDDKSHTLSTNLVVQINVIHGFIVAVVQTGSLDSLGSSVFLFVSKDGETFEKAIIEGDLVPDRFSFLPSTEYSLHVSVLSPSDDGSKVANILASDSDGHYFRRMLRGVESSAAGFLNLDKIETIEGAWTANILRGFDPNTFSPLSRTKITLDDGYSWSYLKTDVNCPGDDHCSLNLLGLEERRGDGQGSTGATPGILLGIGNEGNQLSTDILKLHTYASRDGGLTWKKVLEDPCIFAFGDLGNIIVAFPYSQTQSANLETSKGYYSLDQAETWIEFELDTKTLPFFLTTAIDGTTTKFIYGGLNINQDSSTQILYSLDFSRAFDRNCEEDDYEVWSPNRKDGDSCFFGHTDSYKRRKQDAKCFINKVFEDLKVEEAPCECQVERDYECNYGFTENSKGECIFDYNALSSLCGGEDGKTLNLMTKTKIVGNICDAAKSASEIEQRIFECANLKKQLIETSESTFHGSVISYSFLQQTESSSTDETMLLRNTDHELFVSHNGGLVFDKYNSNGKEILGFFLNPYFHDDAYLVSADKTIHVSHNRAKEFEEFSLPSDVNGFGYPLFTFSNYSRDEFIYYGEEGCDSRYAESCKPVSFITKDSGKTWSKLVSNTRNCDFVGARYTKYGVSKDLIYCEIQNQDSSYQLVTSEDFFQSSKVEFERIVGFATTSHFTVIAAIEGDSLKAFVTIDGKTFAPALFPENFRVDKQQAYTILGSETGAIFLHVTTNEREGSEFGSILKSNANGTSYVLIEQNSNRNMYGFVDFERVEGLDGIAIINTVRNPKEALKGSLKELESKVTFNDGSDWEYLIPPGSDSQGNVYPCSGKPLSECSLHLHGYTERKDFRDTYSSGSAIGLLIGVGNVGEKLTSFNDGSTFMTRDGGLTWKEIKKGVYQWEYGDSGSIIALVDDQFNTNILYYSLDEGNSWNEYQFTEEKVKVDDIVTIPSDNSKKFLLITRSDSSKGSESKTFGIDFENIFNRACVLDLNHPDSDDFEYWTPKHPYSSSECLFGHESKYLRKVSGHECFIADAPLGDALKIVRNCACTRRDFECDFNYIRSNDGTCKLIHGLNPKDASEICKVDPNAVEYFEPTGYRRVPMSTCEGGQEFDKVTPKPCKGKESEFLDRHGGKVSGFSLVLVILLPIFVFIFVLWFVYDRGIRRNGGFQRFGEIRLGDENDLIENNKTDVVVNKIVRGGITIIAGIIATYKMIKLADRAVLDSVKGLFSRAFTRNRSGEGYSSVSRGFADDDIEEDILNQAIDDDDYLDDDDDTTAHDEPNSGEFRDNGGEFRDDADDHYTEYEDDRNLE